MALNPSCISSCATRTEDWRRNQQKVGTAYSRHGPLKWESFYCQSFYRLSTILWSSRIYSFDKLALHTHMAIPPNRKWLIKLSISLCECLPVTFSVCQLNLDIAFFPCNAIPWDTQLTPILMLHWSEQHTPLCILDCGLTVEACFKSLRNESCSQRKHLHSRFCSIDHALVGKATIWDDGDFFPGDLSS